jgi:hypothetical protein
MLKESKNIFNHLMLYVMNMGKLQALIPTGVVRMGDKGTTTKQPSNGPHAVERTVTERWSTDRHRSARLHWPSQPHGPRTGNGADPYFQPPRPLASLSSPDPNLHCLLCLLSYRVSNSPNMRLGDFEAVIRMDGEDLEEYGTNVSSDGKTISCWVPSQEGKVPSANLCNYISMLTHGN